jgi:flagellar protein FlaJ
LLKTQFLDVMAGLVESGSQAGQESSQAASQGGQQSLTGDIEPQKLSMMFFHAVTLQSILSGFISGYMRDADLLSGVKYTVILMTIALLVWGLLVGGG